METELSDEECQKLLDSMDMKVGSGSQVEEYFRQRVKGLKLDAGRPPAPVVARRRAGTVYFQVERDPVFWRDVADTYTMAIRLNLTHASFQGDRILSVARPGRQKTHEPAVRPVRDLSDRMRDAPALELAPDQTHAAP